MEPRHAGRRSDMELLMGREMRPRHCGEGSP